MSKMNLASKLHQEFVINRIKEVDWDKGSDAPLVVELDTTQACDLACPGCISEDLVNKGNAFTTERLLRLGREFYEAGVKAVILIGGGEPLAHPAVGDLMNYLGERNIHIGITTNGSFIDRHIDPIANYSKWTRVSVDAGTDETFLKLRPTRNGKSKFNKIIDNMRMLAKRKTGKLGYSYLIRTEADGFGIESNIQEMYTAAKLAKDIGCDYFEPKPSYQFANDSDHYLMVHDEQRKQETREQLERVITLETDNFKIIKSVNLDHSLNGAHLRQSKKYTTCPASQLRTLITPTGGFVCPYFRGKKSKDIGDLREQSFMEMWHGQTRKETMDKLDPSKDCGMHCIRHDSNLEAFKIIEMNSNGEKIETIEEFDFFI